jgi:hypothetical protein
VGDKSGLCLWCGRFTELRDKQGMAQCDRPGCVTKREHDRDCDCDLCEFQTYEVDGSTVHVHLT